jgi:hypothetical protein
MGVVAVVTSLALLAAPKLAREARAYDHARALGIQSEDRSGWHAEPAVVMDEQMTRGRSKSWKIELSLRSGERQTVLIGRGNLRGFVAPGSRVDAQFWRGKITQIRCGDRQADTWSNPDWLLYNNRMGSVMCSLLLLALAVLLAVRVKFRVRFRIA